MHTWPTCEPSPSTSPTCLYAVFGHLAARFGVLAAEARLRWLSEVGEVLGVSPHLARSVPPEVEAAQDRDLVSDVD